MRTKRKKEREREKNKESTIQDPKNIYKELPSNFMAVIASAITIANFVEKDNPGSFQSIIDEMYKENNIPLVKFPQTVIAKLQLQPRGRGGEEKEKDGRKRKRSEGEEEEERMEILNPLSAACSTSSLLSVPQDILYQLTSAPTPTTPATSSPNTSPSREGGAIKKTQKQPDQKKSKKGNKGEPDMIIIIIIAPNNMNFKDSTTAQIYDKLKYGRYLKYIYQNNQFQKEEVKKIILQKKLKVSAKDIYYLDITKFQQILTDSYYRLEGRRK